MKRTLAFLLAATLSGALSFAQKPDPPKSPAVSDPTPFKPGDPVALDEEFVGNYEDYLALTDEVARLEAESGRIETAVSIRDFRERAQRKLEGLQAWTKSHKVPVGYNLDFAKRQFDAPEPVKKTPPEAPSTK